MTDAPIESTPRGAASLQNRLRAHSGRLLVNAAARLVRSVRAAAHARATRRVLCTMSEEQLRDIGLTRADVERAGWF